MTQREAMQLTMLCTLKSGFFRKHEDFCNNIPALKILRKQLITRTDKISDYDGKKVADTLYRDIKLRQRRELCEAAFAVSSGLFSYAFFTKNKVLINAVNYCFSDFYRSVEETMLARCRQVLRTAQRTKELSIVGFEPALIEDLKKEIKKYEELSVKKSDSKLSQHKNNRVIKKLLKECMNLIENNISPLMTMLKKFHWRETGLYFNEIQLKKPAGRKKKRNKHQKSKIKIVQQDILQQKSAQEIIHRFAELAVAE